MENKRNPFYSCKSFAQCAIVITGVYYMDVVLHLFSSRRENIGEEKLCLTPVLTVIRQHSDVHVFTLN